MNKTILIVVIILLVGIGGYFLLRGEYQSPTPTSLLTPAGSKVSQEDISELTESEETAQSVTKIKELNVSGIEYRFNPSSITVKTGDQVRIIFKNDGRLRHNFVVEGLGINTKVISGGKTDTIEFTAPASGTYIIFCSIPGHRLAGMEGLLKVE